MFKVKTMAGKPSIPKNKAIIGTVQSNKWVGKDPARTMPRFYVHRQP